MNSSPTTAKFRLPPMKALVAFEAASRLGSFVRGADELAVTPSAISHQIQLLEDFLGVQLFQRHAGKAVLTQAGRTYAVEIKMAFEQISNATNVVSPQSQDGHLVVAASPSFAVKWLQPRLIGFLQSYPDVKIRLSTLSENEDLLTNRYDLVISYGPPLVTHTDIKPLLTERLRPLCSPELVSRLELKALDDLARATLIHSSNALTWGAYFRRMGMEPVVANKELWLDRSMMAIEAATAGLGVVLESELLAEDELREGRLVAPFEDASSWVEVTSYYLVSASGFRKSESREAFVEWLQDSISKASRDPSKEWR
ncbi:transcriptional regulator GcvA [Pseudomonas agarici]|nr:transcriptional regulator GcvA [Pseudomonas agarici]NWC07416.1 transcriptional regulator GcvA [Pseudomonas agarici]